MKLKLLLGLLAGALAFASVRAAEEAAPRQAKPERYAKAIEAFAAQAPARHGIVFIGSSATTRWKSLADDFPDLPVVNRAFGGSRINDLIFYFDTIARRHEPKLLVIDIGGNDLNAGLSVDETFAEYLRLLEVVHTKLPQARVVINSLGISLKRVAQIPQILEMNARLARWVQQHDWARYVDRTPYQLRAKGQPVREDYVDDLLHPSRAGYVDWMKVLGPVLREEWAKVRGV
ncbi:GDSL-type esterase/lipase family protein [Opitutus sp. ER46]|uniref:GDSL-type esterase/lipase family protein n=1 Tax=Opitutus sp. ER46 TaxID=2161864 RepID=UPI001304ABF8|nr:GDSL-type esterase/lipase family protein [Opitutus sp. ER46]